MLYLLLILIIEFLFISGVMSHSLSRLRGLAQGLSSELDDQNDLIDRVQTSADKADMRISRQNKDMERLLRK